jgi:hypothetical protein
MLLALGIGVGACTTTTLHSGSGVPRVLGQESGTPDVVGQPAPAGTGQLAAVSCATALLCWAVGTPGSASATPASAPSSSAPSSSAPSSSTTSTSAPPSPTTVVDATVNGGRTWVAQPLGLDPAPALTGISCPTARLCMAVGLGGSASDGVVLTTHDAGASWEAVAVPTGATVLTSVECQSAIDCTVIATDGATFWSAQSVDFGRLWQRGGSLPAGLQAAGSLTCVTGGACLVTGFTATTAGHGQGAIVISSDSGTTWTAANVPAKTGLLQSVDCATVTSCVAAGTTSTTVSAVVPAHGETLTSQDGGQTWTPSPARPPIDEIYGVACPSPRLCAMVGTKWVGNPAIGTGGVAQSRNGGQSFVGSTSEYTPLPLIALDCPTTRGCIAVGGNTLARIVLTKAKPGASATPSTPAGGVHRPEVGGRG